MAVTGTETGASSCAARRRGSCLLSLGTNLVPAAALVPYEAENYSCTPSERRKTEVRLRLSDKPKAGISAYMLGKFNLSFYSIYFVRK